MAAVDAVDGGAAIVQPQAPQADLHGCHQGGPGLQIARGEAFTTGGELPQGLEAVMAAASLGQGGAGGGAHHTIHRQPGPLPLETAHGRLGGRPEQAGRIRGKAGGGSAGARSRGRRGGGRRGEHRQIVLELLHFSAAAAEAEKRSGGHGG